MIEKIRWDIIVLYIDVAFQDLTPNLKMPVPGEQREKLQGTLGFSDKMQGTGEEQQQTTPEPEKGK